MQITNSVIDELVANPQWLLQEANAKSQTLETILRAVLKVLSQRGDERISPALGVQILEEVVHAIALRQEFVRTLDDTEQAMIVSILDTLFAAIFNKNLDPKASWQLLRGEAMSALTEVTLRLLSETQLPDTIPATLKSLLKDEIAALAEGELFTAEAYEKRLATALAAH